MGVVFLLGSGISRDADLPGVPEISQQVLSGEGVFLGNDALFHLDASSPNFEQLRLGAEPAIMFVKRLDEIAGAYYAKLQGPGRVVDYEELAFLAGELDRAMSLTQENPGLLAFAREVADSVENGIFGVRNAAMQAHNYIRDVTLAMLDCPPTRTDHLRVVFEACEELPEVDLFTLNHDVVLEAGLVEAQIDFSDGFEREYGDLRIWNDRFTRGTVRLLKLHGSISWWGYRIPSEHWRGWVTARVTNGDAFHARGPDRQLLEVPHDLRPVFLAGTFDKIFGYEMWIYPDQHYRFSESLRVSNRLVVIGYGFRDQAINSRLIAWLSRSDDNRIIIAHGEPDEIPRLARTAIQNHWQRWLNEDRVRIAPSWVAGTEWAEIAALL